MDERKKLAEAVRDAVSCNRGDTIHEIYDDVALDEVVAAATKLVYPYNILVSDERTLKRIAKSLINEWPSHAHTFEVRIKDGEPLSIAVADEQTIDCVIAVYEARMPGITTMLEEIVKKTREEAASGPHT